MDRFWKGIIVGLGGIAPGLSGSVLLIIFGLYRRTLDTLGNLFRDFWKNLRFLLPLVAGMVLGVLLFSKLIDFLLVQFEMPTRFCFLGLILGTLPMVWREVKKEGISPKYIVLILLSAVLGLWFFAANPHAFAPVAQPTVLHSVVLGVAVAATAIIPGVDPAVFLSTFGLYEMYVGALASVDLQILLPMLLGLAVGAMAISYTMSWLFKRYYTATYSVIFGIFLSMIPNMLNEQCVLRWDGLSAVSVMVMVLGFGISFYLGDMQRVHSWIRSRRKRNMGGTQMKKIAWFLIVALLSALFCACGTDPAEDNASAKPDAQKQDELTSILYHPDGADADISLDAADCGILIRIANEMKFTSESPMNLSIKFNFVIRHYSSDKNDFFNKSNVKYVDQEGNVTTDHVDVRYYLCYSRPMIVRMYETTEGYIYESATLSAETIKELKAHFAYVESLKQQIEAAWLRVMGGNLPQWCDRNSACEGVHYYGTYSGYDILFISGNLAVVSEETIGSVTFTHSSSMALYAHKDGRFYLLRDLYDAGEISNGQIRRISERHVECQQNH